jgi:cellulose 1,4-beta-cellobiosidase
MTKGLRGLCALALALGAAAVACGSSSSPGGSGDDNGSGASSGSGGGSGAGSSSSAGTSNGASSGAASSGSGGPSTSSGGASSGGSSGGASSSGGSSSDGGPGYSGPRASHVANPYAGATFYVDASWAANVTTTAAQTSDATLAAQMKKVAGYSTAVWMDSIEAIAPTDGSMTLAQHLDAAVSQQTGSTPVVITIVVYDLPGRDCDALASNGELPATSAGLTSYEHSFIDPIVSTLGEAKYGNLRIVTVIEPDSLPNIVTNGSVTACQTAGPFYEQGIEYALNQLHPMSNVYIYLDSGHAGWLGWPDNSSAAATEFAKVAQATTAGFASIDGFITDTANYTPLIEPYMTATQQVGGQPVDSASFYQYNPELDESDFAADMYSALTGDGFPSTIGMLIDTSRNGWGGSARPTMASTSTAVNPFVDATKVDQRAFRGLWCNQSGAGLGQPPQASPTTYPAAHLHAYVWVKPPGQSDGTSATTTNSMGKMPDPNCNPSYENDAGVASNALPNAPLAGQWFAAQFTQLVQNAYPAVP